MSAAVLIIAGVLVFASIASFFFAVGAGWQAHHSNQKDVGG